MKRALLFIGTGWAFGSVHYELTKYLHARGIVCDVLDWSKGYTREEFAMLAGYYDCIYGVPGETWPLTDTYGVPHEKIVVVAHGEYDLHHFLQTRPREEILKFAGYGVLSEFLLNLSQDLGIPRVPKIVRYGVNYKRFFMPIASELKVVGYGGSMHRADETGVDWKRGVLAREATEAADLDFKPAGSFHFLAMPRYYSQVDAVLVTSLREGFGLPAIEAAAAGRLVISTPVGGFPHMASIGAGIVAPLDSNEFTAFVAETLKYYKNNSSVYVEACRKIQASAAALDWDYVVDDWIALLSRHD